MISALGLDLGRKRIGIAGCDRLGLLATGLTTLHRQSFGEDVAQLQHLCQERQVEILVVGLPYTLQGEIGTQARQVQKLATRIGDRLALPIDYVDERLTSFQAEEILRQNRRSPRRDKALVDQVAATIILQQWLDQRRSSLSSL